MPKNDSTSTELEIVQTGDEMIAALRGTALPDIEDPEVIANQIMDRILSAENAEEVLEGMRAVHAQDVIGQPFVLNGVKLLRSAYKQGLPVFAVLDAEFGEDGRREAITCGASNVVAQAVQLFRLGALPRQVKFGRSETSSGDGKFVLYLESV